MGRAAGILGRGLVAAGVVCAAVGLGSHLSEAPGGQAALPIAPTATVLAASTERIDQNPAEPDDVREMLESSVLLTEVTACGVNRQGTTTLFATEDGVRGFTNAHVVRGADSAGLSGAGLGVGDATVELFLDGRDAAVLDVTSMTDRPELGLEVAEAPDLGAEVYTAGFPAGTWKVQRGRLVGLERRHGWGGDGPVLVVDVPAEQGTSGGVVVDSRGRAIGLIAARDPRTGNTVAYPTADIFTRPGGAEPGC